MPLKRVVRTIIASPLPLLSQLPGGNVLDGVELDVLQHAILALDLADIGVLDDVASGLVQRERPARALESAPLYETHELVCVELLAFLSLQARVEHLQRVPEHHVR